MRRRTFLGLGVAAGGSALARPAAAQDDEGWRFELAGDLAWRLVDRRGRSAAPGGTVVLELAGRPPIELAALDQRRRIRTGPRRGDTTTIIGRLDGLEVTAGFADGAVPRIVVSVRGLDDRRDLVAIRFADDIPVRQPAWINGYQSWSRGAIAAAGAEATGHWMLALLPGGPGRADGLGYAFGAGDAGAGEFRLRDGRLAIVSNVRHRPLSVDHAPAAASLVVLPSADPLTTLAAYAGEAARTLTSIVPAGWCSWYELFASVTEEDVLANLEVLRRSVDPADAPWVQLDDGFQRAAGDWDTNGKFPHGHRWLTDRIREAGFRPGLWLAPFAVTASSGIPYAHPEWLVLGEDGRTLRTDLQPHWGGQSFALDGSQRAVRDWLRDLARTAVQDWGYEYLKLDFLHYGALGARPERGVSPHEALRLGLRALREGAGRAFLLGCGAPLQHSQGLFDGMRVGGDVDASWDGIKPGARAALLRAPFHRRTWLNDPDGLVVREPLTLDEARAWASIVALSGGMTLASDHLPRLADDRRAILQRTMPVAPVRGMPLDLAPDAPPVAPALLAGNAVSVRLDGGWRFRPGDDPSWAHPALDDGPWSSIEPGVPWERAGWPDLDGYGWYRVHFQAPARPPAGELALLLGMVDDADEVFLNGARIGATGAMPPAYRAAWQAMRRYPVSPRVVRWGEENVLAVRVYDGGGGGGLWRLAAEQPPALVLARAAEDRWMLAVANWGDAPRRTRVDLAAQGVRGPVSVFDVWAEARLPDASSSITLDVPPRSATVVGLRRARSTPCVLGTSRHVVQGAVDIAEEQWDARERVLRGRSIRLDRRPYVITLAVPPGLHPVHCTGTVDCAVVHAHRNARVARLTFAEPAREIAWEVGF